MAKYLDCGGLQMPAAGLGTWQSTDEEQLEKALDVALETGYRHIDTAFAYGNENVIGRVLKRWFDSGKLKRSDIFLVTKCPVTGIHQDSNKIESFLNQSLESLQLDYVDLYLLHFPACITLHDGGSVEFEKTDHIAVWRKMEEQLKAGRTKTIGLSNFNIPQIKNILANAEIPPGNLQVELHVFLQQRELVKYCQDNEISVVAYSPLATPGFNEFLKERGLPPREVPDALNDPTVAAIAKKHNRSNGQVLLRFLLQQNIAVIPKSVNPERVKQNFKLYDFSLDNEDMAALKKLERGEKGRIGDWLVIPELDKHPDYPFNKA